MSGFNQFLVITGCTVFTLIAIAWCTFLPMLGTLRLFGWLR